MADNKGFLLNIAILLAMTLMVHSQCTTDKYQCPMSDICIDLSRRCDGKVDCGGSYDELNCASLTDCRTDYEHCPGEGNNLCIDPSERCNGQNDCMDNSDEDAGFCADTPCPNSFVRCVSTNTCVPGSKYCDGISDCSDDSDEPPICTVIPSTWSCPALHFKCDNNRCISDLKVCDTVDDCGDGSDENVNCTGHRCRTGYFTCEVKRFDGERCIPTSQECDGVAHCQFAEDEDEDKCDQTNIRPCDADQFSCDNGLCILSQYECDHHSDCGDGSDEHAGCDYPQCSSVTQFTCDNGVCIAVSQRCDGNRDCIDNSDEKDCPSCSADEFTCENGRCVSNSNVCDGSVHCQDGSDERFCGINECLNNPCDDVCTDTATSFVCSCVNRPGFVLAPDRVSCVDFDECAMTPDVCSQICLNTEGSYSCDCTRGYDLQPDGSCSLTKTEEVPHLFVANRYYLRDYDTANSSANADILANFEFAVALDYDMVENQVFVSDVISNHIIRMDMNGENKVDIIDDDADSIEGLAVDWVGRKLYFSDRPRKVLEVCEMDGSNRRVLKRNNLSQVRGVAVDPKHGNMYWTDWGLRAYIGRMGMDGSNAIEIHNKDIAWPNGITVDYTADRIYWTDAHLDHIAFADLDGNNIHEIANDDVVHRIAHPFSVAVFDDWVYWTEWNIKRIYRAHKLTGEYEEEFVTGMYHRPFDLAIYHSLVQDTELVNPCGTDNGGCSHLCLLAPGGGYSCLCPDNYEMDDDGICVERCLSNQFHCSADADCIPWFYECNGEAECSDGEDERNCPEGERVCDSAVFQCDGGFSCIPIPWLCDGEYDCSDHTDESHCINNECQDWEFRCNSGKCIPRREVCDRDEDCPDNDDEDEELCAHPNTTCSEGYFSCANGFCVPEAWVCDLDDDCGDMSDEPSTCYQSTCPPGWFGCQDSYRCIPNYLRCNLYYDCRNSDTSDEDGCPEVTCDPIGDFRCDNHKCIPKRWECDFNNDCGDRSDEYEGCVYRPCSESEFRCSNERCLQGSKVCNKFTDCPNGEDEDNCGDRNCPSGYRNCAFGTCINETLFCNGRKDCYDNSDEIGCVSTGCEEGEFRCTNNRCIPVQFVCDGMNECGDGSDETREACQSSNCDTSEGIRFRCRSSDLCIWRAQVCDGHNDCGESDTSDEERCTPDVCTGDTFRCPSGECVPFTAVCDDNNDCLDNYDELGCDKDASCDEDNGGCEHICTTINSNRAVLCQCRQGYTLAADGRNCVDVNECTDFNCIQSCSNSKGSYRCSCSEGYSGQNNSCIANGEAPYLIIADGQSITRVVDGIRQLVVDHQSRIEGLDYMFETNNLYFVDSETRSIKRHSLQYDSQIAPENLAVDNLYLPVDMSIDWIGRNIYFTDQGIDARPSRSKRQSTQIVADPYPKIAVADLDGLREMTLTKDNVEKPTAIAVNPRRGYVYWADLSYTVGNAFIAMAYMNGENSEKVVQTGLVQPRGLTIDFSNDDRVFWVDYKLNVLQGMLFDGSNRKTLVSGAMFNPFHVEVFEDQFYWTASTRGEVIKANRLNPSKNLTEVRLLTNPAGLKIFQVNRYPQNIYNPCSGKRCRDLCLLQPDPSGEGTVSSCDEGCNCRNGGVCLADGTCRCPNGLGGEFCTTSAQQQSELHRNLLIGLPITLFVIIIVLIILLLLYVRKRRVKSKRETSAEVSYNNGNTNVHLDPQRFPGNNIPAASNPVYNENTFNPGPTTYDNPGFIPPVGAAGGPAQPGPEKTGLPGDEDLEAGALPEKDMTDAEKLAMYTSLYPNQPMQNYYQTVGMPPPAVPHAHMPEPPPAYRAEAAHGERVDDVQLDPPNSGNDERGLVDNEGQD
ncbi:low-density lipoprotein receptor-related protein 2-like isoform X2 [Lytechinus variegatus]|uniref:low-density lipoprotein receptor-related protein 2-like isoform X2 n=1 Tax=Lytechinus variegatus TaxID=7654 RepID=UPI001BB2CE45|nr:low-density lipoprotein receptor-related protein 2-like isoform X2 [Lytechinus variegatus]